MCKKLITVLLVVLILIPVVADDFEIGEDYFDDPADRNEEAEKAEEAEKVEEVEEPAEEVKKVEEPVEKVVEKPADKPVEKIEVKKAWWCAGTCDMTRKKNQDDHLYIYKWNEGQAGLWLTGYVQGRYTGINDDSSLPEGSTVDAFALQKARLAFNGKFASWAGLKLEFNIWDAITHEVSPEEIYLDFPLIEYLSFRAGLIKAPILYQRAMSGSSQLFADEAMVVSQKTTMIKGFEPKKTLKNFPSKDIGLMVYGDLFPWTQLDVMKKWPKGILRYFFAYQNGYDMKKGTGRGDAGMYTLRFEANPFGAKSYNESSWDIDKPYMMFAFNWGKSIDLEITDAKKDAGMMGVDGIMSWQGVSISGAWAVFSSTYPKSFEREKLDKKEAYDSSWKSEGFYVQAAAFLPLAFWKIDLRRHLEFKFRYEEFDPFKPIGENLYSEAMLEEFVPVGINTPQDRKTKVMTFGANVYFDLMGWKNKVKVSFDYSIRDELESFRDINDTNSEGQGKLKNVQLRNDMWILQLQLAL